MSISVVLADDHAMVRESLTRWLATTPDIRVVAGVVCAEEAIAACVQHKPDVVLIDIDMPGMDVFAAARRIKSLCPETQVVMLSAFFHDRYIEQALAAGASGYVTKSESVERIAKAVREVAAGAAYFSPDVQARLVVGESGVTIRDRSRTRAGSLSQRELEILRHLARGLSNKEIAARVDLAVRTVDHHIARIMKKLDLHGRMSLAQFAVREGFAGP